MLCLVLIGLLRTKGSLILAEWLPALTWALPGAFLCLIKYRCTHFLNTEKKTDPTGWALLGGMCLFLFSSAALSPRFFLQPSIPSGEISPLSLAYTPARIAFGFSFLTAILFWKKVTPAFLYSILLIFSAAMLSQSFLDTLGGQPIYRDDHPAFMHRFWGIREAFPAFAYYDPGWNGGGIGTAAMASGAINLAFLFQPLWQFGPVHEIYNGVFILFFMVCVPLTAIASARLCACNWAGSIAAGCMALTLSRYYLLWLLNYGTVSACSTSPALMILAACLYRTLWLDRREWWLIPLFSGAMFFYLAWPPAAIMGLPVAVASAVSLWRKPRERVRFVILMGAAGLCAALPHYIAIFANIDLGRMAGIPSDHPELTAALAKGWRILLSHFIQSNPLIVFLGILGVLFVKGPGLGRFFIPALFLLMLPAGWGETWKPQYQLVRSGIPLMFLALLPAAFWIGRLVHFQRSGRIAAAVIGAFLFTGTRSVDLVYANQTPIRFYGMSEHVKTFVEHIKFHSKPGDRILFAGPTVHGIGGGHVAYLPVLTGREMMACDYYAFSPKLVEYEYPPRAWRERAQGIREFLEFYNVSHVVTYHKKWIQYFEERPDEYRHELTFGNQRKKKVYRVHRASSLFLQGAGEVQAQINEILVFPENTSSNLVIKYNWVDDLRIESPAEMAPFPLPAGDEALIQIHPNGLQKIRIYHKGLW